MKKISIALIMLFSLSSMASIGDAIALHFLLNNSGSGELTEEQLIEMRRDNISSDVLRYCKGLGRTEIYKDIRDILPSSSVNRNTATCKVVVEYNEEENKKMSNISKYKNKREICDKAKDLLFKSLEENGLDGECTEFHDLNFEFIKH